MTLDYNYFKEKAKELYPKIQGFRRHIHQNPELSFQEFETSKFIKSRLDELNIKHKTLCETGVVAHIGDQTKDCIALRADIDALPIIEETGLDYSSLIEGKMHACGHDMHTSMLLGATEILKGIEGDLNGCVKLIYQLGEEKLPGGASLMINEGVLENPKPKAVLGQHIYPGENVGIFSTNSGYVMGSADELYITVKGNSTHAAQPHLGFDPILASASIIQYVQNIITKFRDPLSPSVINITSIHGGSATNIIPNEVKMMGTIRTFNEELQTTIHHLINTNLNAIAETYGCTAEVNLIKGYPPVFNNKNLTEFVFEASKEIFGESNVKEFEPKMWGEDFAYYGKEIPACFWFLGVKNPINETMPALHNSKINPEEEAMILGTAMMAFSAWKYLKG